MPVCHLLTQCLNFGLVGRRLESGKLIPRHYVKCQTKKYLVKSLLNKLKYNLR